MRNISTRKVVTATSKTHWNSPLVGRTQINNSTTGGEKKQTQHVSWKKNNWKALLFRYNNVSIVAKPPTAPPPPRQLLYECRQPIGRRQFHVLLRGLSRQLVVPDLWSQQAGRPEGVGSDQAGRWGRATLCSRWLSNDLYTSVLFYMKKKSNNSSNPGIWNSQLSDE